MIEMESYAKKLPTIVPPADLQAWRNKIKKVAIERCPEEVSGFIEALADKLDDFIRVKSEMVMISGEDLLLGGMSTVNGEQIYPFAMYPTPLPVMLAADHRAAMYRIYHRKGKQGLIDFCRNKVRGSELERTLQILNVHVFKTERAEFRKVMEQINTAKKLESDFTPQ